MRKLDIGIASYRGPEQLRTCIESIQRWSATDHRIFVCHNPSPDDGATREIIESKASSDPRIIPVWLPTNVGYSGAVNKLFELAETELVLYADNDIEVLTPSFDETLCGYLDRFHELAMVFPNGGAFPLQRPGYMEILWGIGFCWLTSRRAIDRIGLFDESIGHQNEVDFQTRARLAGYRIGAAPEVQVLHRASSTNDPSARARIDKGVEQWCTKWVRYFCGQHMSYHSPNVLRFEDWHPTALYMEEWWAKKLPGLNAEPEVINVEGIAYDLIKVPRLKGFYRNRTI